MSDFCPRPASCDILEIVLHPEEDSQYSEQECRKILDQYLTGFAVGPDIGSCGVCGCQLGGKQGSFRFLPGVESGEGFCRECGAAALGRHNPRLADGSRMFHSPLPLALTFDPVRFPVDRN